jgi:Na+/proline symporter
MDDVYLYLGIYIALLLGVSYFVSRGQTKEDFLISGRNRKGWQILASKFAGAIGAGYFISYTGFAYEYGVGVFAMLVGIAIGYLLFAYWAAPKAYENSKENKFYTIGDFVYHKTKSRYAMNLSNFFSNIILFLWLLVGIIGGAKIINDFGFLSYNVAVLVTSFVVLAYIMLAGFKAVVITDFFQSIIILLLLLVVTFGVIGTENIVDLINVKTGNFDLGVAMGFFLFGVLAIFSYSNMYQLTYAAKSKKNLIHGLGLAIIPVVIVAFFLLLIGTFMFTKVQGLDSGLVFTESLKNFLPVSLLPFAIVLFFAGIMSSADTNIYAITSHHVLRKEKVLNPISKIRKTGLLLMIFTAFIAILFPDIVNVSIIAGGFSMTLSFAMIYLFFDGANPKRFISSVIFGLIGFVAGVALEGLEPVVAVFVLAGGVLGLLWKGKKNDIAA